MDTIGGAAPGKEFIMLTYDEKTSGEIARAVTLLRTQLERLAAAPILLDGRDARAAVSAGGVCISVGLTEDCRSDGDWAAMSIDGYHVIGRGDSPEAAVLKMQATEVRLHRVVEAITGSRCAEVRSPDDLLYERVMCGGVYVDALFLVTRGGGGRLRRGGRRLCSGRRRRRRSGRGASRGGWFPAWWGGRRR